MYKHPVVLALEEASMTKTTCKIDQCARDVHIRGWCNMHYLRWWKHGDPMGEIPPRGEAEICLCSIDGCDGVVESRGWCAPHYHRWWQYGDPLREPTTRLCEVEGCTGKHFGRGFCVKHYVRLKRYGDPSVTKKKTSPDLIGRLQTFKIVPCQKVPLNECWEWTGDCSLSGYGVLHFKGATRRAHVFSYIAYIGPVPPAPRNLILHYCDNPPCINPLHLRAGTYQDNTNDKLRAGRHPRGEAVTGSKLTETDVLEIWMDDTHLHRELAARYGVARQTIGDIKTGRRWKHFLAQFQDPEPLAASGRVVRPPGPEIAAEPLLAPPNLLV